MKSRFLEPPTQTKIVSKSRRWNCCVSLSEANLRELFLVRIIGRSKGRPKEPAILISTLLLQTHARLFCSLALTRFLLSRESSTTNVWNAKNAIWSQAFWPRETYTKQQRCLQWGCVVHGNNTAVDILTSTWLFSRSIRSIVNEFGV